MFGRLHHDDQKQLVWLEDYGELIGAWNAETGDVSNATPLTIGRLHSPRGTYLVDYGDDESLVFLDDTGKFYVWLLM